MGKIYWICICTSKSTIFIDMYYKAIIECQIHYTLNMYTQSVGLTIFNQKIHVKLSAELLMQYFTKCRQYCNVNRFTNTGGS